jgi:hypothetical protein
MKRVIKTFLMIVFSVFYMENSYAIFNALKLGAKAISKIGSAKSAGGAAKVGAIDPVSGIDEVASGLINTKKIDKDLISQIGKEEHSKIFNGAKSVDDNLFDDFKNFESISKVDNKIDWNYLHILKVDIRLYRSGLSEPKPTIYVCEDNKKSVYYFTLLPKKNIALVTSSNKEVAKQRLQINRSGANGSYFSTYSTDSKNYQFVLLPDYKALIYKSSEFNFTIEELKEYRSEKNITNSIDSSINAECFNPKSDGSLERIEASKIALDKSNEFHPSNLSEFYQSSLSKLSVEEQKKFKEEIRQKLYEKEIAKRKKIIANNEAITNSLLIGFFPFLIIFYIIYELIMSYITKLEKNKKIKKIPQKYNTLFNFFGLILYGGVGYISFFALVTFDWKLWYQIILIALLLFYSFTSLTKIKAVYLTLKNPLFVKLDLSFKLHWYFNIAVPGMYFLSGIIYLSYIMK